MIAALFHNDLRHWLIILNFIAFLALFAWLIYAVYSPHRTKHEERSPANLTPFLSDEDLESRRLERVQGWALLFAAIVAITLPIYWLREPTRQSQSVNYFDENSVHRGEVLFSNAAMPTYDAAVSLQCANCHGTKGQGGVAPTTINGVKVAWKAPPLNTELLRFSQEEVTQIITYGRPGTPMAAWGVEGGGPKNDQAIADLVNYINSIQITPAQAQKEATDALAAAKSTDPSTSCPEYVTCPAVEVENAKTTLETSQKDLATQRTKLAKLLGIAAVDTELKAKCDDISKQVNANPDNVDDAERNQAIECGTYLEAASKVDSDQKAYNWSLVWQSRRTDVSDGQILFEYACARCHTKGWSVFNPLSPPSAVDGSSILGLSGGGGGTGGGIGYNLRDGGEMRRFGNDESGGFALQVDFVTTGSENEKPYGILGIGTGRMPGFGSMLTKDQIAQIVSYERYCLSNGEGDYTKPIAPCATGTTPRTPPTTTSSVASKG